MLDWVFFQVRMIRLTQSNGLEERQILIIECKRPSKNTPAEWEAGQGQLLHYCENNVEGSKRIFGAVAIRTLVKFWRYNNSSLSPLSSGQSELLDGSGRDQIEQ